MPRRDGQPYKNEATERAMAWAEANRERVREYQRQYRETHREALAEAKKAWAKAHPKSYDPVYDRTVYERRRDKRLVEMRAWKAKNLEKLQAYRAAHKDRDQKHQTEHYRRFPEKNRARANKRRVRLSGAPTEPFTPADIVARVSTLGERCVYCMGPYEALDHIWPVALGGAHAIWNLAPVCRPCNSAKRSKRPDEWAARRRVKAIGLLLIEEAVRRAMPVG
jgi:5-methylcytosine-specific restriction endonuclease McrA